VASECARSNIKGAVFTGDLYDPLPPALRGKVRVLVANAPYVPVGEVGLLPAEARDYEPLTALSGGTDGLQVLRRVAAGAPEWLAPGGCLLSESSEDQAPALAAAFAAAGLHARVVHADEATIVIGQLSLP
jgi:release factor glutamine methyltransferase